LHFHAFQIPEKPLFLPVQQPAQMKKVLWGIFLVAGLAITACTQSPKQGGNEGSAAAIAFDSTEHNFGTLPYAGDGTYNFIFRNTGSAPLLLTNVRSSCGCTIPSWPKEPIAAGTTDTIRVSYNTHISGRFSKSISVFSNATATPVILKIKGTVLAAAE
jgi:hypothetical protein